MVSPRILVCDDEPAARRGVTRALGSSNYRFEEASDGLACLEILAERPQDLVLLDLRMPGLDGSATLERIVAMDNPPPVVVLTADDSLKAALGAVKAGAADFITKPYEIDALRFVVERTLERAALQADKNRLEKQVALLSGGGNLIGSSSAMVAVRDAIDRVAPTDAPILITGPTGTGKGLAAQRIHQLSAFADGPFVSVNCAAIPDTLVESELFGYRKGAFTGADKDSPGRIRNASEGTLLLDEIGDLPLAAQAKLLRVLQDGVVEPLGGGPSVAVEFRALAATHRDLRAMVEDGSFREDLLFRLRVVELEMPALSERGADVIEIAQSILAEVSQRPIRLTPEAETALERYSWPGNVRELRNAIERATIFCRAGIIQLEDLPAEIAAPGDRSAEDDHPARDPGDDFQTAKAKVVERFERTIIGEALQANDGNVSAAARALGMHRQNLQKKIRQLGLESTSPE